MCCLCAGTAVASAYVEDIARFQAHRFVGGIAPIKSICRVSSAAAQLLAIPKQQLYQRSSGGEEALPAHPVLYLAATVSGSDCSKPTYSMPPAIVPLPCHLSAPMQAVAAACPWLH